MVYFKFLVNQPELYNENYFKSVETIDHDWDALVFNFQYTVKDNEDLNYFKVVLKIGAEISWHLDTNRLHQYKRKAFALVIDYFKRNWEVSGKLPEQLNYYYEGKDLIFQSNLEVESQNFELDLPFPSQ